MLMAMYEALTAIGGELEDLERLENPKGLVCVPTSMGCFGAQHAKRTLLWCTQPEVAYPLRKTLSKAQHKQLTGTATTVSAATHREMLLSATVSAHHLSVSAHECTACLFFDVSLSTTNGNGRLEYDKQEQTYSVLIGLDWEK